MHGEALGKKGKQALLLGGWGHKARDVFSEVNDFLGHHAGEIVILRISHTKEEHNVHGLLSGILGDRLLCVGPQNLARLKLSSMRGKAVAIFDSKALARTSPIQGTHRLVKDVSSGPQAGLPIFGEYAGQTAGPKKIVSTMVENANLHGAMPRGMLNKHNHLFMIYWQEAGNVHDKARGGSESRLKTLKDYDKSKGLHYNLDLSLIHI